MSRFFLFALLTWITGNPLLAVLVIVLLSLPGWWAGSRWAFRLSRKVRSWGEAGHLRRALAINPHDAKARTDLGAILARQGRFREARAELEQAMPRADHTYERRLQTYLRPDLLIVDDFGLNLNNRENDPSAFHKWHPLR